MEQLHHGLPRVLGAALQEGNHPKNEKCCNYCRNRIFFPCLRQWAQGSPVGREWLVLSPQLWATARGAASGCSTDTAPSGGASPRFCQKNSPTQTATPAEPGAPTSPRRGGRGGTAGGTELPLGTGCRGGNAVKSRGKDLRRQRRRRAMGKRGCGKEERRGEETAVGLQGANFLTERRTQHPGTTQTDTRPPNTTAAPPLLPSCQPRAVPAAPTRPRARPRHG